jgi:hypothetical protein
MRDQPAIHAEALSKRFGDVPFGSANTGVGLADDLARGLIDRFRALPMARPALLAGRTLADTAHNTPLSFPWPTWPAGYKPGPPPTPSPMPWTPPAPWPSADWIRRPRRQVV